MTTMNEVINTTKMTHFILDYQKYSKQQWNVTHQQKHFKINVDNVDTYAENWSWDQRQDFKKWLNHDSVKNKYAVPYGLGSNILLWPNIDAVMDSKNSKFDKGNNVSLNKYINNRKKHDYFDTKLSLDTKDVIHFPSCVDDNMSKYRYLGQIATSIAFDDYKLELKFKVRVYIFLY